MGHHQICEKIEEVKQQVITKGKCPGTGESYIGEYLSKMEKNVLFVMPNNRQLQEKKCEGLGLEGATYNKFFSIAVSEDGKGNLPSFDYSMFGVFVFDEVFMVNIYIYIYMLKIRLDCFV